MTRKIVVATNNLHKIDEIRAAFSFNNWEFVTLRELGVESDPEETGMTFLDNARIKAEAAHEVTGLPALADDSGLEVDALDGRPGVYSARYAGEDATDGANNEKLLEELSDVGAAQRTARFKSVLVFLDESGAETVAVGTCEGRIDFAAKGEHGFGYDPLFLPDATPGQGMAELTMDQKNAISHRGNALRHLREQLTAL